MGCKICGGEIIRTCRCPRADVRCEHGHTYHWSIFHKEYHKGLGNHETHVDSPNCCTNRLVIKEREDAEIS